MSRRAGQLDAYGKAIKFSVVVTAFCILTAVFFYGVWVREGSTGIALLKRGGVVYRDSNPAAFASSHFNSLCISVLACVAALGFLFNTVYQARRRHVLNRK